MTVRSVQDDDWKDTVNVSVEAPNPRGGRSRPGRPNKRTRERVRERDLGRCCWCGSPAPDGTVEHLLPLSLGGRATMDNLRWACRPCNHGRGASPSLQGLRPLP